MTTARQIDAEFLADTLAAIRNRVYDRARWEASLASESPHLDAQARHDLITNVLDCVQMAIYEVANAINDGKDPATL